MTDHKLSVPRGTEARHRLIEVALDVFGTHGYDGATTRMIAERAGVSLPTLPYHFGSKEGLYHAVAAHVAECLTALMAPAIQRAEAVLGRDDATTDDVIAVLQDVCVTYAGGLLGGDSLKARMRFVTRELTDPTTAFEILYQSFTRNVASVCCRLIGRATGHSSDDAETRLRTLTILGQLTVFRKSGEAACRFMGWSAFGHDELAAILALVQRQTRVILRDAREG
ncbi:MAG: CerR family C-terminal domain-containing protein [Azospirillaceae bacterium]|nr:CerR family C-terminal domain-containing protein [Azospirillaceae bacterium]